MQKLIAGHVYMSPDLKNIKKILMKQQQNTFSLGKMNVLSFQHTPTRAPKFQDFFDLPSKK